MACSMPRCWLGSRPPGLVALRASAAMLGLTYDLWLDPGERIGGVLRYAGLPASMLVDREGVVVWTHVGVLRETTPGFSEALEEALLTRTETKR